MLAAVVRIQRFYRLWRQKRVLCQLASNYHEYDPISFETLSELPPRRVAVLKCPVTSRMFACDAVAWATYFANNHTTIHPCTRQKLDPEDIWNCYLTAYPFLPEDIRTTFQSSLLTAVRKGRPGEDHVVNIRPISPLYMVKIFELKVIGANAATGKKKWLFVYALGDSRDIGMVTKPLRIEMELEATDTVEVSAV